MKPKILDRTFWSLAVLFSMELLAAAAPDANPYQLIAQKNSFRLLAPVELSVETPQPAAKIWLLGLTTALGRPLALLKVNLPDSVAELFVILGEGEHAGSVVVGQINRPGKTVSVLNNGRWQLLYLDASIPRSLPVRQ